MTASRVLLAICLILLALVVGVFVGPRIRRAFGFGEPEPPSVVTGIERLNQLITVRYSIQRVVGTKEQKQPVGEESLLLMVQGEVQAGVDLSHFSSGSVHFSDPHTVAVILPRPQIMSVYLDEQNTKVWDRRVTWWTPWVDYDPNLEHKARQQALEEVKKAALDMGILRQAQRNAEIAVRDFLEALHLVATVKTNVS